MRSAIGTCLFSVFALLSAPALAIPHHPGEPPPAPLFDTAQPDTTIPQYVLEAIRIDGNRRTLKGLILRHLELRPGEVFASNDPRLENAKYRLLATGLFHTVQFDLHKGAAPGYVVLHISVSERNTFVLRDLSFGLTRIGPYWDQISPWGSIGIGNRSFLGSGVNVYGTVAGGREQFAFNVGLSDDHIFHSAVGLRFEGLFAEGSEYFGQHYLPAPGEADTFAPYSQLAFRRTALRFGSSYNRLAHYSFSLDFRFESILTDKPKLVDSTGTETALDAPAQGLDPAPPTPRDADLSPVGHLEPDLSTLTTLAFGFVRDTRDSSLLTTKGALTHFTAELSHPIIGSSYEYTRFTIGNSAWFPFGRKLAQSFCLTTGAGLVVGNAPFFEQFFVGDYSAFIPSRVLGLNFTNLHPNLLNTAIKKMWYEDIAANIGLTWNIALYRGQGGLYGIDGFITAGFFALTSSNKIGTGGFPVDMTTDLGVRFDTHFGLFTVSLGSIIQLVPPLYKGTTE